MTENIQILTPTLILNDNDNKYDLESIESPQSISDKHKKDIRKLLRTEYGGEKL